MAGKGGTFGSVFERGSGNNTDHSRVGPSKHGRPTKALYIRVAIPSVTIHGNDRAVSISPVTFLTCENQERG